MRDKKAFVVAVEQFIKLSNEAAEARNAYRVRWSKAYLESGEKTDTGRKAAADIATSEARVLRDMREINTEAARHVLVFERGPEVILDRTPEE